MQDTQPVQPVLVLRNHDPGKKDLLGRGLISLYFCPLSYGKVHRTQNLPFESAPSGSHHITVQPSPLSSSRIFPACPKETLCPFAVPPCHPPPPAPGHHSLIFASAFIDSEHVIQRDSYGDPCVSGFVHSAYCFQSSSMLEHVLVLRSFLWLNNIPL